jgi:hypothetical protein
LCAPLYAAVMRRLTAITVLLTAVGACWVSTASAELRGQYATQTFVIARYVETRAVDTVLNTGLARMEAQASRISGECSGVLLHAPIGTDSRALSVELEFSIVLALLNRFGNRLMASPAPWSMINCAGTTRNYSDSSMRSSANRASSLRCILQTCAMTHANGPRAASRRCRAGRSTLPPNLAI